MRPKYIMANWKSRLSVADSIGIAKRVTESMERWHLPYNLVLCPSFLAMGDVARILRGSGIKLGAQNVLWDASTPLTGEIQADALREVGCTCVVVGHSERRTHLKETDEMIRGKVQALLARKLIPVICVGEGRGEESRGEEIVRAQLLSALEHVTVTAQERFETLVVAYEPAWAISTNGGGTPVPPEDANRVHALIRRILEERFPSATSTEIPIVYGGSISASNISAYLRQPEVDGALVGGASQNGDSLLQLLENARTAYEKDLLS